MESLQDLLLEHKVPDQCGQLGKIRYRFAEMKIAQVHWPKVSSDGGFFVASNGALRLQGTYELHRPGVLGYTKSGEFVFDLGAICLTIRDFSQDEPSTPQRRHERRGRQVPPTDVTCTVGIIKVKFHGGAAMICQLLTSLYIKMYRRHIEAQIVQVIQETFRDDKHLIISALKVMAAVHTDRSESRPSSTTSDPHDTSPGRIQRFIDSMR